MLYNVGLRRALTRYGISKEARHAVDRLKERTTLDPKVIAQLDSIATQLTKDRIPAGNYYLPLPKNEGTAAFKTVGPKNKLVLATILSPGMKPRGSSLSHIAAVKEADEATGPELPEDLAHRWDTLKHLVGRRGVFAGTAHRRITIPKNVLSENDLGTLGFQPVMIAIPEAGQDRFTSYRHPDNTYHLHSHGDRWTLHKDRHAAATMLAQHQGRLKAMISGAPHVVTEGLPGLYYYAKGQVLGRGSTADEVDNRLKPDVKEMINSLAMKAASISFPREEFGSLQQRLGAGRPIFTTRVSKERGKYQAGQVHDSPLGVLKVVSVEKFRRGATHPFASSLTAKQRAIIAPHPFDLVKLEKHAKEMHCAKCGTHLTDARSDPPICFKCPTKKHKRGKDGFLYDHVKGAAVTTELEPHQERAVRRIADPNQRGLIVAHALGSGKTLTAIAAADRLGLPADVVVPASLRANFEKELAKHTDTPPPVNIQSVQAVARDGGDKLQNPLMIVDEAHRARNPTKTQRALASSWAQKRLLLTGSLLYNDPADIAGPVNLVAGEPTLPWKKEDFHRMFVRDIVDYPSWKDRLLDRNARHTSDINPEMKPYLEQVLRKYVDYHPGSTEHFPTKTEETIKVPMSPEQRKIYSTVMGRAPAWVRSRVRAGMPPKKQEVSQLNAFLAGARQVSNTTGPYQMSGTVVEPKIDSAVRELQRVLDENPRAKALVYSNYLDAGINPYKQKLESLKIPFGEFTGEMPRQQRQQLVKDYNADKIRALLLSSAGGEGLDLQGTRLVQVLEPHWNEEKLKQVIGRGVRYQSHEHLPEEERNVHVQRFLSVHPKRSLLQRLFTQDPGRSVDEYLQGMAANKEKLNDQFRGLLADKTAAEEGDEDHTVRNTLMAGAAGAPWLGLVGQKPMIHLDQGVNMTDHAGFLRQARPGDVLVTGDPSFSGFKGMEALATGHPEGYHTAVVGRDGQIVEIASGSGLTRMKRVQALKSDQRAQLLRPKFTDAEREHFLTQVDSHARVGQGYREALRGELAQGGRVPGGMGRAMADATGGTYDFRRAVGAGVKELFVPKLHTPGAIETARQERVVARKDFNPRPAARGGAARYRSVQARGVQNEDLRSIMFSNQADARASSTCSSLPALSMPKGKAVVPGKLPHDVLPTDFLRSEQFTPVARYNRTPLQTHEKILRYAPTATRLGVGLLGAGAVYGASKLLSRRHEEKEAAYTGDDMDLPALPKLDATKLAFMPPMAQPGATYNFYGAQPQPQMQDPGAPAQPAPKKKKSWLPAAVAGGVAGLGMYKFMRTPSYSANPALAKIQQKAVKDGFHPVINATHPSDTSPRTSQGLWDDVNHAMKPRVDEHGQMGGWDKFKTWLRGGSEAIPTYLDYTNKKDPQWRVANTPRGTTTTNGIVYGRADTTQLQRRIHGGTDLEGSVATQRAATRLSGAGKGGEADFLQQHAPDALPYTVTNLGDVGAPLQGYLRGRGEAKNVDARVRAAQDLQRRLQGHFKAKGHEDFFLKPTEGLASSGKFPRGSSGDWGEHVRRYEQHLGDAHTRKALMAAERTGMNEHANYLKGKGLYEGYVLHDGLRYPGNLLAQAAVKNPLGEFRVHSVGGTVPHELVLPRHRQSFMDSMTSGVNKGDMAQWVEQNVLKKLPAENRKGMYGMDVMPYKREDGSVGYHVLEMNPYARGSKSTDGFMSGLLDSDTTPLATHKLYRAITGRHTEPVSALAGLGAGASAALTARALTPARPDEDDQPQG